MLLAEPVFAQSAVPTDLEELRHKQQREEAERQRQLQAPDARIQKEKPAADTFDLPEETPCFQIKTIRIEGDKDGNFPWIKKQLAPYEARCIGRGGINQVVKRVTNQLIARGYVTTRVGVPEQDISSGTLRLLLIPGIIKSIRFSQEKLWGFWQTAFPARPGDVLNIRDLEQGLEQMKRVPYQDVDLDIRPGDMPGESDVIIIVKRQKFWRANFTVDDSGGRSTGKLQGTAGLSVDNPLGMNDLFSASYSHDLGRGDKRGTYGSNFYYSAPYGYWTTAVSGSGSKYYQTVTGQVIDFVYSGTSKVGAFTIQRMLYRDQVSKTSLQLGINKRWSETYLNDVEIEVQRRKTTEAQVDLSHRRYLGSATLDSTLSYRQGVPWFGAQSDPHDDDPDSPTTRYKIETLSLSLNAPFQVWNIPMRYIGHARGQYTQDRLLVSEQFSIGSRYTVRGFDGEQVLLAERGWYIRNEIGVPIFKTGQEFYVGIDHGDVGGPSAEMLPGTSLTGGVVGLRGSFDSGKFGSLSYDVFAGWPIDKPSRLQTANPTGGFQVTYQF